MRGFISMGALVVLGFVMSLASAAVSIYTYKTYTREPKVIVKEVQVVVTPTETPAPTASPSATVKPTRAVQQVISPIPE